MRVGDGFVNIGIGVAVGANFGDGFLVHDGCQPASFAAAQVGVAQLDDDLGGGDARHFLLQRKFRFGGAELRHGKFAGSDIDVGDAHCFTPHHYARQEVVAFGGQHSRVDHRAGGDDAYNFAVNQSFRERGIAGLLAYRYAIAFAYQARQVAIGCVMRETCHGRFFATPEIALRQRDLQFARYDFRVIIEHFIEVAHAKKEDSIGVLSFDL